MYSPRQLEQRSLALHVLAAEKLRLDNSLLAKVRLVLDHWGAVTSPRTHSYLAAWQAAVNQGVDPLISAALEDSEHGAALRQASPLVCLLSNSERFSFFKKWAEKYAPK
jgi:hypothetical protein